MRILHTSDWHLGRSFHGEDLLPAQVAYVDHLIETIESHKVDLVVVSGDIYDRALPPVDAVALADETLHRLGSSRARAVLTSGNHDSQRRLGVNARLIDLAGVHLRTDHARVAEPIMMEDEHGPVAVYGIPYLEPDLVTQAWDLPTRSHHASLAAAMERIRTDLSTRPEGTRSVVLAHAFVAGGQASDSERDIAVGGVSIVSLELFDGIDYTALGHLHGRSTLSPTVRYSGSPVAYSFSESAHVKGSWLVDLDADGFHDARFVEAPVLRPLARLRGTLEELLADPALETHLESWIEATLTDEVRPLRAMDRLHTRFPRAVSLRFAPSEPVPQQRHPSTVGRSAHEVTLDFVTHVREVPATDEESALLLRALECCPEDADLAPERAAVVPD